MSPILGIAGLGGGIPWIQLNSSSEPSSYSFTSSTLSATEMSGVIVTYQNGAFDTVGSVGEGNVSGIQTAPSINVAVNDSVLLAFFVEDNPATSWSNETSGLTKIVSDEIINAPSWALYEDDLYPSGASGNKEATCSGGGDIAVLVSLSPTSSPLSLREAGTITQVTASDGVLSLTKPSSTQKGDLMVAFGVIRKETSTWSMPSGWTEVLDHQHSGGKTTTFIAYKIAA